MEGWRRMQIDWKLKKVNWRVKKPVTKREKIGLGIILGISSCLWLPIYSAHGRIILLSYRMVICL